MKNGHPIITATSSSSLANPDSTSSNEPAEPIIRLKLDKPLNWEWELTTSADTLPVIQLLDKDGRVLVETSGRTAQRARGSFREGLKSHEEFQTSEGHSVSSSFASSSASSPPPPAVPVQGNRNVDGFSSKFGTFQLGYKPRKSRSEVSMKERDKKRGRRKDRRAEEEWKDSRKYSMGDYLRQQIIDDLGRKETLGKSAEEIARERCKKVKAYLRSRSETLPSLVHVEEEEEAEEYPKKAMGNAQILREDEEAGSEWKKKKKEELERVRSFLRRKIQQRMELERSGSDGRSTGIQKRYSYYGEAEEQRGYRTRKVQSETSVIRFDRETVERDRQKGRQMERWSMDNNRSRSRDKSGQKAYGRSRSETILEEAGGGRERSLDARDSAEKRKLYRKTRSDALVGQMGGRSADSSEGDRWRGRRQDTAVMDESWREYKERKKQERLRRDAEGKEEDFRWKDAPCTFHDCKICQNLRDCVVNPVRGEKQTRSPGSPENGGRDRDDSSELLISLNDSANEEGRASTSLRGEVDASPKNHVLVKVRARSREAHSSNVNSPDCGYNTIPKKTFNDYKELYARSNVKKSDTFKIVDGSEGIEEGVEEEEEEEEEEEGGVVGDGSIDSFDYSNGEGVLTNKSNEDIARDYFKRVYELLKRRQKEARRVAEKQEVAGRDDSSSSNYAEKVQKRRLRRKKKERGTQGEEVVTVPPASGGQDSWKVQRLSLGGESASNRRKGCRPQLQAGSKRARPPPPIPGLSCKVNAKDVDGYPDHWPNKENTPGNGVNNVEGTNTEAQLEKNGSNMGSNLSRHNGKGLTGRRTQSSGNLCDPKGKLNSMGKILVPCSSAQRERYKFCGSLPNHLDDKDALDDDPKENNNVMTDTISGNLGGTLPHKKRSLGVHFSDGGPTGTLDLVKHRSQDSLDENDPWRYQQSDLDLVRCRHGNFDSVRRNRNAETLAGDSARRYTRGTSLEDRCHRNSELDLVGTLPKRKQDSRNGGGKGVETNSSSSQPCVPDAADNDLLMQIVHKPDCELVRHRQQLGKCIDLKLSKLAGGEPQDQGYASERSPEDEHPPSLPGQPFPNITAGEFRLYIFIVQCFKFQVSLG
ncbi:hypothetical protein APICC_09679 [Apis cerana cerana]|uniref:Uncharacterized protein n=1 Tax=Apis cerana cerana TaxID=94128 RepID=A0A2A3EQE3_APICC|nr:hypothetical protein APICC_09679 [Apis cerana cerana]